MDFFIWKKERNQVSFSRSLGFCEICKLQEDLWCHHRHYCIWEVTLLIVSFEPWVVSNRIWSNVNAAYDGFENVFTGI